MMRRIWRRLTSWMGRVRRARSGDPLKLPIAIAFDAEGFSVAGTTEAGLPPPRRVRWPEVQTVGVFKRDIFAFDMICLMAELPGPQTVELNEDMEGWQAFVEALPEYLPGIKPWHEWFTKVAFSAFETNFTLIFSRQAHASRTGVAEQDASGR